MMGKKREERIRESSVARRCQAYRAGTRQWPAARLPFCCTTPLLPPGAPTETKRGCQQNDISPPACVVRNDPQPAWSAVREGQSTALTAAIPTENPCLQLQANTCSVALQSTAPHSCNSYGEPLL